MRLALLAALALTGSAVAAEAVVSPAFSVALTLSPKAAAKIAETGERIMVVAMFNAMPKPGSKVEQDGAGPLDLGQASVTLDGVGTANFAPFTLYAKDLAETEGEPDLLINVWTARQTSEDNLLSCDLWQGPLATIPNDKPIPIACKLIEEP